MGRLPNGADSIPDDDDDDDDGLSDIDLGLDAVIQEQAEVANPHMGAGGASFGADSSGDASGASSDEGLGDIGAYDEGLDGGPAGGDLAAAGLIEEPEEKWEPDEFYTGDRFLLNEYYSTFDNFEDLQAKANMLGSRYLSSVFDTYAKRVGELVFRTARRDMLQKTGNLTRIENAYHLVSLNFFLDTKYQIYLSGLRTIKPSDAFPAVDELKEEKEKFLTSLKGLVLETNDMPQAMARMRRGDSYGDWRMVFSEVEEKQRPMDYDPCDEFKRDLMLSRGSILKNAWLHNYAEKRHAANKRELNKYIEKKWDSCKHRPTREMMASCIRNTISYRYKMYLAKENAQYQDGYVDMRIRDLYAKWEAAKKAAAEKK
mmetsp:Transcript_13816/g.22459  ORF Transcript_13816/g.22459 Transcript_13816/m.22459 type:complete len:372 (-) Transcript_13816:60-1175(-)